MSLFLIGLLSGAADPAAAQAIDAQPRSAPLRQPAAPASKAPALVKDARSPSGSTTLGIVTGAPGSTASTVGYELATVIAAGQETGPNGEMALRVVPMVGRGGIQNVRDVLTLPGADMGIVPTPVLDRLRVSGELGDLSRKLVYIARLYPQELHILARREVQSISDLAGKSVSVGDEGTEALARDIFQALALKVTLLNLDHSSALDKIRSGELAAALLVSGKPAGLLSGQRPDDALHLIAVDDERLLDKGYLPARLTGADYPNLLKADERVETVAVGSVLFAYKWPAGSPRHRLLADFVQAFFPRIEEFHARSRHPKWQEINLAAVLPEWRRFEPAERWLKQTAPALATIATDPDLVTETGSIISSEKERLFQEFLRWREQQNKRPRSR